MNTELQDCGARRRALATGTTVLGVLASLLAGPLHAADDTALQRCRAVSEATARLACYDAMPLQAAAPARAAASAPPATRAFGQERRDEPESISSHISGSFEGWGPRTRFTLANGQVWQVVDGSEGVYALHNPRVTVKRALMGGFVLDIEGARRTPRVRRVE